MAVLLHGLKLILRHGLRQSIAHSPGDYSPSPPTPEEVNQMVQEMVAHEQEQEHTREQELNQRYRERQQIVEREPGEHGSSMLHESTIFVGRFCLVKRFDQSVHISADPLASFFTRDNVLLDNAQCLLLN